jgi:hypothetical protein
MSLAPFGYWGIPPSMSCVFVGSPRVASRTFLGGFLAHPDFNSCASFTLGDALLFVSFGLLDAARELSQNVFSIGCLDQWLHIFLDPWRPLRQWLGISLKRNLTLFAAMPPHCILADDPTSCCHRYGLSFQGPPDTHVRADGVNANEQRQERGASY